MVTTDVIVIIIIIINYNSNKLQLIIIVMIIIIFKFRSRNAQVVREVGEWWKSQAAAREGRHSVLSPQGQRGGRERWRDTPSA